MSKLASGVFLCRRLIRKLILHFLEVRFRMSSTPVARNRGLPQVYSSKSQRPVFHIGCQLNAQAAEFPIDLACPIQRRLHMRQDVFSANTTNKVSLCQQFRWLFSCSAEQ